MIHYRRLIIIITFSVHLIAERVEFSSYLTVDVHWGSTNFCFITSPWPSETFSGRNSRKKSYVKLWNKSKEVCTIIGDYRWVQASKNKSGAGMTWVKLALSAIAEHQRQGLGQPVSCYRQDRDKHVYFVQWREFWKWIPIPESVNQDHTVGIA